VSLLTIFSFSDVATADGLFSGVGKGVFVEDTIGVDEEVGWTTTFLG
jgi:hypothetical protein